MRISKSKWKQIRVEVRRGVRRLNEIAEERGRSCLFFTISHDVDAFSVLAIECWDGNRSFYRAIAREITTGEMRRVNVRVVATRVEYLKVKPADPPSWKTLKKKPGADIVRRLGLLNFDIGDHTPVPESAIDTMAETA